MILQRQLKKQSTGQSKDLNIITKLSHEVSYRHFRFCFVSVCTVQTEKLTSKEERWNLFSKLSYNIEVWESTETLNEADGSSDLCEDDS